ncbi:MAG: cupin domain-containing protein [Sphingomonadales bacterium]|nr:cupin domain-containing protein [Sphingomonadales bacterium]
MQGRRTWTVTRQFGLTQFGVNRVELPPGGWSTNRHWHSANDEAVIVVSGELVLVSDDGEEVLRAGDCVCFKAGVANGHHLQNRSQEPAVYFDIGGRDPWDVSRFPDIGLEARTMMQVAFRPLKDEGE